MKYGGTGHSPDWTNLPKQAILVLSPRLDTIASTLEVGRRLSAKGQCNDQGQARSRSNRNFLRSTVKPGCRYTGQSMVGLKPSSLSAAAWNTVSNEKTHETVHQGGQDIAHLLRHCQNLLHWHRKSHQPSKTEAESVSSARHCSYCPKIIARVGVQSLKD